MTKALDDHPLVAEILVERARALSRDPSLEALVLVAHGPVEEADDRRWLEAMGSLGDQVRRTLPFREVRTATLRDDAPPPVRKKAVRALRREVRRLSREGGVLVVPLLVARGGIEAKVLKALDGLKFRWEGRGLAPHPNLTRWVESRAREDARAPEKARP